MERDGYGDMRGIGWVEDIKGKFIDWGEDEGDGKRMVEMIKRVYENEDKDKMGVEGWRVEENVVDGKKYGGEIVGEIKDVVDDIEEGGDLLGKREVKEGMRYVGNEWNGVVEMFNYGES